MSPVAIRVAKVKTEGVVIIVNIVVAERTELGEDLTCLAHQTCCCLAGFAVGVTASTFHRTSFEAVIDSAC